MISFTPLFAAAAVASAPCPADQTPPAHICRALEAQAAGNPADGAARFEQAAAASPAGDPAQSRMLAAAGNLWISAGQPGKAAIALDRALAGTGLKAEQHGLALLDRARAAEAQGDLKTARTKVTEAAKTIAEDPYLWFFSAALAIREDDIPTAQSAIARALRMAPDSPEIMFEAGHVAQAAGDPKTAREHWQRAMAADPKGKAGQSARDALAMLDVPITVAPASKDKK